MRLGRLRVRNYRCLESLDLDTGRLTAIIGANGTGKSSVIRALEFLFGQTAGGDDDVTANSEDREFEVAVVLDGLDEAQHELFGPWLGDDGTLTVGRRWTGRVDAEGVLIGGTASWFSTRRAVAGFVPARSAAAAADFKARYAELRADPLYADLPAYKNRAGSEQALSLWEADHPEADRTTVEDGSLTFDKAGTVDLRQHLDLLVVPAVRDPAVDAGEAKGSNLGRLTDLVLHSRIDLAERLADLRDRTAVEYRAIVQAGGGEALAALQTTVSAQLDALAPGTAVQLDWQENPPSVGTPSIRASIVESGYVAQVGRQGHGVQRAYVFALLRALVDARGAAVTASASATDGDPSAPPQDRPSLLIVIEEPELYQHPVRSQYLARTLAALADDDHIQVLYATHSPHFAGVERLDAVRLFRMAPRPDGVSVTGYSSFDPERAVARLNEAAGRPPGTPWTVNRLRTHLAALLETPVGEGLFARAVLLVEGHEDRGALRGTDDARGADLTGDGVAVVHVDGKDNLARAYVLYEQLGVPVYVLFDGDTNRGNKQDRQRNALLTGLLAGTPDEAPGTQVHPTWACASTNLMDQAGIEIGHTRLQAALVAAADDLGLDHDKGMKNGVVVRRAVQALAQQGTTSSTLEAVLTRVRELVQSAPSRA